MLYQAQGVKANVGSMDPNKLHYLGIDQHAKQLTISLRNAAGEQVQRGQVGTQEGEVREFLQDLQRRCRGQGYVAIVEVCGFNDWLLDLLVEEGCLEVVLVQPEKKNKHKSDRRDAYRLGELLWVNRERLAGGQKLAEIRRVHIADAADREDRRLTGMRVGVGRELTRTINRVKHLLRRLNLQHRCPTKGLKTVKALVWLRGLEVGALDRMELDDLLGRWEGLRGRVQELDQRIVARAKQRPDCRLLQSIPGAGAYTALGLACRIGPIDRFPRGSSLANFFGLAPGLNDSGESMGRVGSITKQGSVIARFLLGELVLHVLRGDGRMRGWYKPIKRRRGPKIARVAVMRRLSCIIQHMLTKGEMYRLTPPARPAAEQKEAGPGEKEGPCVKQS
jgi:transposase